MKPTIHRKKSGSQNHVHRDAQRKLSTPFFTQRKPKIGPANDSYEQEADRVADSVVRGETNVMQSRGISHLQRSGTRADEEAQANFFSGVEQVQKQEEEEEAQAKPLNDADHLQRQEEEEEEAQPKRENPGSEIQRQPMEEEEEEAQPKREAADREVQRQPVQEEEEPLQMQAEEEEEAVQTKTQHSQSTTASPRFYNQLAGSKGSGSPLQRSTQAEMSSGIGADFSNVRIHTDSRAAEMSQSIQAKAFTVGNHIYFNKGEYNPQHAEGKRLLAHELTHTVQQGAVQRKVIQRDPPSSGGATTPQSSTPARSSGGSAAPGNPLARAVTGLLRDQLSNSSMRGHLSSLGTALQGLATGSDSASVLSAERLAALNIPEAFKTTSRAILADSSFRNFRQRIIDIIGTNDATALATVLAAALAATLANVRVRARNISQNLGAGFSVGGGFDLGNIQSLQFNNLSLYAQYANRHLQTRVSGSVQRNSETNAFVGTGVGQLRLGNNTSHILGRVSLNSDGEVTLTGHIQGGYQVGRTNRLLFSTRVQHTFADGETVISPGVSGRFSLGHNQSLRLGSNLQFSTNNGRLTGATGYIEYQRNRLQLRIEGNMNGLGDNRALSPGSNMTVQGMLTIRF
jgi:hypothetical protein